MNNLRSNPICGSVIKKRISATNIFFLFQFPHFEASILHFKLSIIDFRLSIIYVHFTLSIIDFNIQSDD